jgi:peptidyl-prolyl cis-trans isomerase D
VLQVLDKKDISLKAKVGFIVLGVEPSKETYNDVYKRVNKFATSVNANNFDSEIKKMGLTKRLGQNVKETDFGIPGLNNAREIIRWAYEAKVNDISKIFEQDGDKYIIAKLTAIKEKGTAPFEYVKSRVEAMVKERKDKGN